MYDVGCIQFILARQTKIYTYTGQKTQLNSTISSPQHRHNPCSNVGKIKITMYYSTH